MFWYCLNPNSDDTGGLLEDDWVTPDDLKLRILASLPATKVSDIHPLGPSFAVPKVQSMSPSPPPPPPPPPPPSPPPPLSPFPPPLPHPATLITLFPYPPSQLLQPPPLLPPLPPAAVVQSVPSRWPQPAYESSTHTSPPHPKQRTSSIAEEFVWQQCPETCRTTTLLDRDARSSKHMLHQDPVMGLSALRDQGPWPCTRNGCPTASIACGDIAAFCDAQFNMLWSQKHPGTSVHLQDAVDQTGARSNVGILLFWCGAFLCVLAACLRRCQQLTAEQLARGSSVPGVEEDDDVFEAHLQESKVPTVPTLHRERVVATRQDESSAVVQPSCNHTEVYVCDPVRALSDAEKLIVLRRGQTHDYMYSI